MGPGDSHSLSGIDIVYNTALKVMSVESPTSLYSKSLFDRDLAPVCFQALEKIKETFGKLEHDTIYLVTADKAATKQPKELGETR